MRKRHKISPASPQPRPDSCLTSGRNNAKPTGREARRGEVCETPTPPYSPSRVSAVIVSLPFQPDNSADVGLELSSSFDSHLIDISRHSASSGLALPSQERLLLPHRTGFGHL